MPRLNSGTLRSLALLGAQARLREIEDERTAIRRMFPNAAPGLGRGRRRSFERTQRKAARVRKQRRMTVAQRKAVSVRMKKYWAGRRKAKAAKSARKSRRRAATKATKQLTAEA